MKHKWTVNILGSLHAGWEISVVREDYTHGRQSYGWPGSRKIIVSESTDPQAGPAGKYIWTEQTRIADELCAMLNDGRIAHNNNHTTHNAK